MNKTWSEAEKHFIKDKAGEIKDRELVDALMKFSGRKISLEALRKKRQELGIKKSSGRGVCALKKPVEPPMNYDLGGSYVVPHTL